MQETRRRRRGREPEKTPKEFFLASIGYDCLPVTVARNPRLRNPGRNCRVGGVCDRAHAYHEVIVVLQQKRPLRRVERGGDLLRLDREVLGDLFGGRGMGRSVS
jgi:hypothetical protein